MNPPDGETHRVTWVVTDLSPDGRASYSEWAGLASCPIFFTAGGYPFDCQTSARPLGHCPPLGLGLRRLPSDQHTPAADSDPRRCLGSFAHAGRSRDGGGGRGGGHSTNAHGHAGANCYPRSHTHTGHLHECTTANTYSDSSSGHAYPASHSYTDAHAVGKVDSLANCQAATDVCRACADTDSTPASHTPRASHTSAYSTPRTTMVYESRSGISQSSPVHARRDRPCTDHLCRLRHSRRYRALARSSYLRV